MVSSVGPNIQASTVVVQARLPANGVVLFMLRLIANCWEYDAPWAWWPYTCTGWAPEVASFIAAGLIFTNALVLSALLAPLAILLFRVLALRVDVAVIWMPTSSQTCAVFISIFSPLNIPATVRVTGMSGNRVDLSESLSFSSLTSCPTILPAANSLTLSSAYVSATKT